ncbi:MAG: DEAD/DEAH box helicase family protein [Roseiflexaceae bacterium]|nr:DEAD/DEAH box helicase family protein [Roseiflexaceae bacterium]
MAISNAVANPIINEPFAEPTRYYDFSGAAPLLRDGRRPAGYLRGNRAQLRSIAEQESVPLELVNAIRARVAAWRVAGYPGATRVSQELLRYWDAPDRQRRLFFAQREAAEAVIWLSEAAPAAKAGIDLPRDGGAFVRYCLKLATGSGKTTVMAMLIAWSVLNKVQSRQDKRFSDAVLIVAPNLTVKERLQVLLPSRPDNYYERFDLVPLGMLPQLGQGKFLITNWHLFLPQDDTNTRGVVKLGPESDAAFCQRVLRDLGPKGNLLVLNDEAHHAYRITYADAQTPLFPELTPRRRGVTPSAENEENNEATIWVGGLDRIDRVRGINLCIDMSATPYYISGSGREEGAPFEWIVSDFGLVDAIESGLVKVPRIPVDDNSGDVRPRYFNLWESIKITLPKRSTKGEATGEALIRILVGVEGALATLASEWRTMLYAWEVAGRSTPPVLILVCNDTSTAQVLHGYIAEGQLLPELKNIAGQPDVTIRIDSRLLAQAESRGDGESKEDAAERLREVLATVGKVGATGERVRCVVSVGMLTEGWDAQNVTHILGLRAFSSQLLCEQVVGRGLRRTSYDDLSQPEYVDVYGIPFQAIPVQEVKSSVAPPPPQAHTVRALAERANMAISFPRVTGYLSDIREHVTADIASLPPLKLTPTAEPTQVRAGAPTGQLGAITAVAPNVVHERGSYYQVNRLQSTSYRIAARIVKDFHQDANRQQLFPQVLKLVNTYIATKIELSDEAQIEDLALARYQTEVVERIRTALRPVTATGQPPILPVLDNYRPTGTTADVIFTTTRKVWPTTRSHVSHVVLESGWERRAAQILESHSWVRYYVRNYKLDFTIPYRFAEANHAYTPDFIVVVSKDPSNNAAAQLHLVLEIKGEEDERDRAKAAGAKRWVDAVNYAGQWGHWHYQVCRDVDSLRTTIEAIANTVLEP